MILKDIEPVRKGIRILSRIWSKLQLFVKAKLKVIYKDHECT
jgi:hypothetical protein